MVWGDLRVECLRVIAAAVHSLPTGLLFHMSGKNRPDVWIHLLHTLRWRNLWNIEAGIYFLSDGHKKMSPVNQRAVPEGKGAINCLHLQLYMKVGPGLWIRKQWPHILYVYVCMCACKCASDFEPMCTRIFVVACAPCWDLESHTAALPSEQLGDTCK